jgi:hypothetical protein
VGLLAGLREKLSEKRRATRHRTRLRPGKLFDLKNNYLVDCAFHDISATGARVRMLIEVEIPTTLRVFDENEKVTRNCRIVWRRDAELGLQFIPGKVTSPVRSA